MFRPVYFKLAWQTLRKDTRTVIPFLFGSSTMTALLYAIAALRENHTLTDSYGGNTMVLVLGLGQVILCLFDLFFFFYLNGFLNRARKKEQGLLSTLGLEKRHLGFILFLQMLMLCLGTLLFGLPLGMLFDKLFLLLAARITGVSVPLGFSINWGQLAFTATAVALIFVFLFLYSLWDLQKNDPLDLLHGAEKAEAEPKARWVLAVLGFTCLAIGYGMALTIQDPVEGLLLFFVAVVFVIIGTYSLFQYGSIVLLKMLQKNKHYYYNQKHFISVANMKYRMKQNAASLANMCILSTMILVAVSTTVSLWVNIDNMVNLAYPRDYLLEAAVPYADLDKFARAAEKTAEEYGMEKGQLVSEVLYKRAWYKDGQLSLEEVAGAMPVKVSRLSEDDYRLYMDKSLNLQDGEAVVVAGGMEQPLGDTLSYDGAELKIKETDPELPANFRQLLQTGQGTMLVITPDFSLYNLHDANGEPINVTAEYYVDDPQGRGLSSEQADARDHEILHTFQENLKAQGLENLAATGAVSREAVRLQFQGLYGGLMMMGIFVATAILVTLVLIMYYKQVSEGYQDQKRFLILSRVGLEDRQVRKLISGQALLMFFLPLGMAAIHIAFAFPMIRRILEALTFDATRVFFLTTCVCFAIFALIYIIVYKLTSNTYYALVTQNNPE